jgi:hypothetical protein
MLAPFGTSDDSSRPSSRVIFETTSRGDHTVELASQDFSKVGR